MCSKGSGTKKERRPSKKGEKWYANTPMFNSPAKKQFEARTWGDVMSPSVTEGLPRIERMRQEAVYELICGEKDYGTTLENICRVFERTLLHSTIEEGQRRKIFSTLSQITAMHRATEGAPKIAAAAAAIPTSSLAGAQADVASAAAGAAAAPAPRPLHEAFAAAMAREGVPNPGEIFAGWWKAHEPHHHYGEYCTNLPYAKHTLKAVREAAKAAKDTRLEQFLSRCTELPIFSRQMLDDLLDLPRQRIVRCVPRCSTARSQSHTHHLLTLNSQALSFCLA
jgi:hypothetical protein